ncbi:hypothetical protein NEOKW01_1829 [Nematocida sp. AWRm80]|nr:hypothetical protein NEOKW01_1829 [Nematocida sp. AWRm80]
MVVNNDSWIMIRTLNGHIKCISMKRDINRMITLPRIGKIHPESLLGLDLHKTYTLEADQIQPCTISLPEDKHQKKKYLHKSKAFIIAEPSLDGLLEMYIQKNTFKLSHETLSQILFHAIGAKRVFVLDDYGSMITAALGIALGNTDKLYRINGYTNNIHALNALGYKNNPHSLLLPYDTEAPKQTQDRIETVFKDKVSSSLLVLAPIDQATLITATNWIKTLTPPQTFMDFLLYHPSKEPLLGIFNQLMTDSTIGMLDLRESFYREYQYTTNATHPTMSKLGHSGYLLTGTFFNKS